MAEYFLLTYEGENMKHYYHPMSRAVTTDWMLKELDVPHEQIMIDYGTGENETDEFQAINPMRKLPALVDDGLVVTEVAAICLYLADKYFEKGMAPALDSPLRGKYYRYILICGSTLEPMFTVASTDNVQFNPQSVGWGDMARGLATLEALTPAEGWVLGDQFSTADVIYGGLLGFSYQFGWLKDPTPLVADYIKRIQARPCYRQTHPADWFA